MGRSVTLLARLFPSFGSKKRRRRPLLWSYLPLGRTLCLIAVLSRKRRLIRQYPAGALTVSNVAFGGPKLDQLFITGGLGAEGESEGALFRLDVHMKGLPLLPRRTP